MPKKMQFTPKRKLSGKDIMGKDCRIIWKEFIKTNPDVERLDMYKIGGILNRFEITENDFGESAKLMGDFIAINLQTGEGFRSNRCYLPPIVSEYLTGALAGAEKGTAVQFGFLITAIGDTDSATGYVYTYESLMDTGESDLMKGVAEKLDVAAAFLPAANETKKLEDNSKGKRK